MEFYSSSEVFILPFSNREFHDPKGIVSPVNEQTWAIVLGLSGYALGNVGMGVQKTGIESLGRLRELGQCPEVSLQFVQWLLGTALTLIGVALLFPALAWGSASVIASFAGFGLVCLVVFSTFVLHEPLGKRELFGIFLIIVGTVLAGYYGDHRQLDAAPDLWWLTASLSTFVVIATTVVALTPTSHAGLLLGACAGGFAGFGLIAQKLASDGQPAISNLFLWVWMVVTGLGFCLTQWAYNHGRAVVVVPSYTCTSMIVPVLGGPLIFHEHLSTPLVVGVTLLMIGVILLSQAPSPHPGSILITENDEVGNEVPDGHSEDCRHDSDRHHS